MRIYYLFTSFSLAVTPSGVEPSHASRGECCAAAILRRLQQPENKIL